MDPNTLLEANSIILADGASFTQKVTSYREGIIFVFVLVAAGTWIFKGWKVGLGVVVGVAIGAALLYAPELAQGPGKTLIDFIS